MLVVVTGGARGIGAATARAFTQAGARVVTGDLDGGDRHLDVRDPGSWAEFLASLGDQVDVLVNNAGVAYGAGFLDCPPALRALQLDVNLSGVVHGMAAVLPGMVARGHGHVVNVASMAGRLALPNAPIYTATKYAVVGLTEAVRAEVYASGVRVSAVLPTFVPTRMTEGLPLGGIPRATGEQVARAVVRLVRRGHPATVAVPRWMGALPVFAALTPQFVGDLLRRAAAGRIPGTETAPAREAYAAELRRMSRD